ncbi:SwmB domain-containing protein [Methanoculleus sp. 10]|uniref:SwmB domain-containing protein n=1 Tax=Methanoculleus sp. 10 TaxID=430615 RepID=UPI0025F851A8|nr:SwmB domain-containing protein [Methanoculleus sp. 10]
MLLVAVAFVVPAMAAPAYTSVEINSTAPGQNWVILNFNESVAWKTLLGDTDFIVAVNDVQRTSTPDVPARIGLDPAPTMDLVFLGPALGHGDVVNVTLSSSGALKILNPASLDSMPDETVTQEVTYLIPPEFVNATTDEDGTQIIIEFNKTMTNPAGKHDQFNFTIGGEEYAVAAVALDDQDDHKIVLTCDEEISFGDTVTVNYTQGDVKSDDGGVLRTFAGKNVVNLVPEPPTVLSANTTTDGEFINITFNREMNEPAGKHDQFTFFVNDVKRDFSDAALSADNLTFSLEVDGEALIAAGDIVNMSYTRGDVTSQNNGKLASFENLTVENNVPASPGVVAAKTNADGNQILVTFDKDMADPEGNNWDRFTYRVNDGDELGFWDISRQDDNKTLVLDVWPSFESSDTVTLTYGRGSVRSDDHGVLLNFTNITVENVMPPVLVQIDPLTDEDAATKMVTLNFSKPVWWGSPLRDGPSNAIVVRVGGDTRVATEIGPRNYEDASNLLDVTFSGPVIGDGQTVYVEITGCGAQKIKETSSENNTMSGWDSASIRYVLPPTFCEQDPIQFKPECGGTNIELHFDKYVSWENTLNDTHITVTVDGEPVEFADVAPNWWSQQMMTLVLSKPITEDGQEVIITITELGAAEIKETTQYVPMAGKASVKAIYAAPPEFEKILVTDAEMGNVTLYFSKPVFAKETLYKNSDIKAMINGEYRDIAAITPAYSSEDAADTMVVKLAGAMVTEGQVVEISITASGAGKIRETVGEVQMLGGNTRSVTHTAETAPVFVDAWTNEFGRAIIVEFDRNMADQNNQPNGFGFVVNSEEKTFESRALDGDNKKRIVLSIREDDTIKAGDTVNLTYTPGSVAAEDGGLLAAFDERIENKKRPILTEITITKVAGDGNEIELLFDEPVSWSQVLKGGVDITATIAGGARGVVDIENRSVENASNVLIATVKGEAVKEGQSVVITVTKSGADKITCEGKALIECTSSTQYMEYHGAPYIEDLVVLDHVEKRVGLSFSQYVSWGELVNGTHITVTVDGTPRRVYKVEEGAGNWIAIEFDGEILKVGQKIVVTITEEGAETISSYYGYGTLAPPYVIETTYTKTDGPVIETVETNEYGNLVYITFDKEIVPISGSYGFEMYVDGWRSVWFQDAWLENDNRTLVLEVDNGLWTQVIKEGNELAISYADGYIPSEDGGVLARFEKHPAENKVTKAFDQIQPLNDGWTLVSTSQWVDSTASEFVNADLVYKYDAATGTFSSATVGDVKPVEALYVKSTGPGWFAANFAEFQPLSTKTLYAGWNLIGVGTENNAGALLSPLRYIQVGEQEGTGITTLVSQGALNRMTGDLYLPTLTYEDWEFGLKNQWMSPVDGYWIYMNGGKDFGVLPGDGGHHATEQPI